MKIGDVEIDKADELLTLSAPEAVKVYDGKPLLAAGIADSLEGMLQQAGLTGPVQRVEPSGFEHAAFWIITLAPLFLVGGMLGAYIEFKTPGFGLPGILSACCFAAFFTGHYIAGLAAWEVGVLFFIGLLLVAGEIFLHPGTIVPGLVGALLMVGALLWAMIDRYPGEPFLPTTEMLMRPLVNLAVAFVLAVLAGFALAKYLPRTRFYRYIVLENSVGGSAPIAVPVSAGAVPIGTEGTAHTMLRPAGKAEVDGHLLDVVTQGDFIDPGDKVRVIAVDGLRVVVERV